VTPDTVAFAVRSIVRLGSAARQAYEQSVRDATMRIPDLPVSIISNDEALFGFFDVGDRRQRIEDGGDLKELWVEDPSGNMVPRDAAARDILIAEQLKILQQLPGDFRRSWIAQRFQQEAMSGVLVKQWKDGTGPPTPAIRLVLAFTDVALDYVGSNPGILGVGGNGEKLITALSANFRKLLPDVDKKDGWKGKEATTFFVERALSITLHAGLKTISEKPDLLVEGDHYRELLQNVVDPFVEGFDKNPNDRPRWIDVRDTLLGPVAEAALKTVQQNQQSFLGSKFSTTTAVGAVTSALLGAIAEGDIGEVFTPEGQVRLYRSVLDLSVKNPRLFVTTTGPQSDIARDLLVRIGTAIQNAPPQFDKKLAGDVAIAAIESLKVNVPGLLRIKDDAWRNVAGDLTTKVLSGLQSSIGAPDAQKAFENMFSPEETIQLLAMIMRQVVQTPGMIAGIQVSDETQVLVATIASATTAQGSELLTSDDWIAVAQTVAVEVARNPGRIISLGDRREQQLAGKILHVLLAGAAQSFPDGKRTDASLLFGQTLREAAILAIQAAVGNSGKAATNLESLRRFIQILNETAAQNSAQIGAREWLWLFDSHIANLLAKGLPPGVSIASLLSELEQRDA
jgi:hypothetical protein